MTLRRSRTYYLDHRETNINGDFKEQHGTQRQNNTSNNLLEDASEILLREVDMSSYLYNMLPQSATREVARNNFKKMLSFFSWPL